MKGVRFYFDYGSAKAKRKGGDAPNALAALLSIGTDGSGFVDVMAALTDEPNSPICGTTASREYIREACKRVSEAEAYRVHPNLRARMEHA